METAPTNYKGKKSLFKRFKRAVGASDSCKTVRRRKAANNAATTTDPVLAVADEDGVVLSSAEAEDPGGEEECGSRRRKKGRDRWQALRTVVHETALMKKIIRRWKTTKKSLSRSNSNLEGESDSGKISNPQSKTTRRITSSNASSTFGSSSAFPSSSSLSSASSSSRTDHVPGSSSHATNSPTRFPTLDGTEVSTKQKQNNGVVEDKRKGNFYGSNTALCMLLISLLVLILGGKFLAILCTAIWFYLVAPSCRRRPCNEGVSLRESELDSVQYKKKIILKGLLERSHSRVSLASNSSMPKSQYWEKGIRGGSVRAF